MQRLVVTILLTLSLVGFVKAQENPTSKADTDEEVKKEMLKYENDLVDALREGGSVAADFLNRVDTDDEVLVSNGKMSTKANLVDGWRSGEHKQLSVDHYDFRVHVYGDTAVVTFSGNNVTENKGKVSHSSYVDTDVLVKQQGVWRRVVHDVNSVPAHCTETTPAP
jgi:ketosteroid isomerase-like protein